MEREREIRAFNPEDYFVITADVRHEKDTFTLTCSQEPRDKKEADKILELGKKGDWYVTGVKETKQKRSPRAPFITSTLQQTASTRLGSAPSRTMRAAQRLYEAGLITYMRTDSPTLSSDAYRQIDSFVKAEYGKALCQPRAYKTKSKIAQEAHEAIRPTSISKKSAGGTDEQKRLYKLIWQRTVASQMIDAEILRTKILANIKGGDIPDFSINGSRIIKKGWLEVDPEARGEEIEVPKVQGGDALELLKMDSDKRQTQPPGRYSEAGLIKELEKRGIGRPSTYASTIRTIVDRDYARREGRTLFPTDTGDVVSSFLEEHFKKYISDSFTAEMENELDEIANGKREYTKTLKDFYDPFQRDVKSKESMEKITNLGDAEEHHKCPKCSSNMIIKLGRAGKFLSCSRFPDCDGALTMEGKKLKSDEPLGVDPKSGESVFLLTGRYGPYVQIGQKSKENPKPRRASVPKDADLEKLPIADALKYLSVPRELGKHPDTGEMITASIGRFGPYIVREGDFRSLKNDDVYTIELPRALEILAEEKKTRRKRKPAT